jgi:hypothetical protein
LGSSTNTGTGTCTTLSLTVTHIHVSMQAHTNADSFQALSDSFLYQILQVFHNIHVNKTDKPLSFVHALFHHMLFHSCIPLVTIFTPYPRTSEQKHMYTNNIYTEHNIYTTCIHIYIYSNLNKYAFTHKHIKSSANWVMNIIKYTSLQTHTHRLLMLQASNLRPKLTFTHIRTQRCFFRGKAFPSKMYGSLMLHTNIPHIHIHIHNTQHTQVLFQGWWNSNHGLPGTFPDLYW